MLFAASIFLVTFAKRSAPYKGHRERCLKVPVLVGSEDLPLRAQTGPINRLVIEETWGRADSHDPSTSATRVPQRMCSR